MAVAAARSVLVELVHLLGEFREQLVVVGGWVPLLLLADAPEAHVGTLDIDLALDVQRLPEASYTTLLHLEPDQIGSKVGEPIVSTLRKSILENIENKILALNPPELA